MVYSPASSVEYSLNVFQPLFTDVYPLKVVKTIETLLLRENLKSVSLNEIQTTFNVSKFIPYFIPTRSIFTSYFTFHYYDYPLPIFQFFQAFVTRTAPANGTENGARRTTGLY